MTLFNLANIQSGFAWTTFPSVSLVRIYPINFVADMLVLAGALDRYDCCAFRRVMTRADDYTAVPIIFSGIFGVGYVQPIERLLHP